MAGFLLPMWFNRKYWTYYRCFHTLLGVFNTLAHPVCCRTKEHALFWYFYSPFCPEYLKINVNAFEGSNYSSFSFNSGLRYLLQFMLFSAPQTSANPDLSEPHEEMNPRVERNPWQHIPMGQAGAALPASSCRATLSRCDSASLNPCTQNLTFDGSASPSSTFL